MLIEEINLDDISHIYEETETETAAIVEDFFSYLIDFNLERVLIVTDEDVKTDIRVLNQLKALKKLTNNITILRVKPDNIYTESQKKKILKKLYWKALRNIIYFPWFIILVIIHHSSLAFRRKAKQGICNDHNYLLSKKIDTSGYTAVICNNLVSASIVNSYDHVDYIYDIHELEVFRNRNKSSIQRSFYIYLKEMEELKGKKNIITISKYLADTLSNMYHCKPDYIHCIYNQNFTNVKIIHNKKTNINNCLLIYIGNVSLDRGLEDIAKLSFEYDILVIACNYRKEAIVYLEENSDPNRLKIFKGMNYQSFLLEYIVHYQHPFFLILINPTHPSYRYALPNKFFQAQSLGCPIIVYEKTYLADIIENFGCGLVFTNKTGTNFLNDVTDIDYRNMKQSMEINVAQAIENKLL